MQKNDQPISLERLFDIEKIVKFQEIENALELHDLYAIYKKYECNLHKATYKQFGIKKLGQSNKLDRKIKVGQLDYEKIEKQKELNLIKDARESRKKNPHIKSSFFYN